MSLPATAVRWVLCAAAASFGAGLAAGLVAPVVVHAIAPGEPGDQRARYVRDMTERYGLDARQAEQIRMVLEQRALERVDILMRDTTRLPEQLQLELDDSNRRANERIKYVLTDAQRARFLRDSEFSETTGEVARPGAEDR